MAFVSSPSIPGRPMPAMSFKQILKFANGQIPDEKVQELEQKLAELG